MLNEQVYNLVGYCFKHVFVSERTLLTAIHVQSFVGVQCLVAILAPGTPDDG